MKSTCFISLMLMIVSCQPSTTKQEAQTTPTTVVAAPKDSIPLKVIGENCQTKGKLLEKFEQNNALFERFSNEKKALEWLKITTKDGNCATIDDIAQANHYSVTFEDWDKDGFKDRINNWKWHYEVFLFDKSKNDFSRQINGIFNGDQWDFDKSQNIKYQFLENKLGGEYELYQLKDANKTILSQISFLNYDDEGNEGGKIEIRKNFLKSGDEVKYDTLKMDAKLYTDMRTQPNEEYDAFLTRSKKGVENYWRKNLALFLKK